MNNIYTGNLEIIKKINDNFKILNKIADQRRGVEVSIPLELGVTITLRRIGNIVEVF